MRACAFVLAFSINIYISFNLHFTYVLYRYICICTEDEVGLNSVKET